MNLLDSRKKILVVEDNENDWLLIQRAFGSIGISADVELATNETEVFNKLSSGDLPCLILMDIRLPGADGIEISKKLKTSEITKHIPIVVFSGSVETGDVTKAYGIGVNGFVFKHVNYDQFVAALRFITQFWIETNVLK